MHPSRYVKLVDGLAAVGLRGVHTLTTRSDALRFVAFVDRLYDDQVRVLATGTPLDRVFGDEMLAGGYRKKYLRAISRLIALTTGLRRLDASAARRGGDRTADDRGDERPAEHGDRALGRDLLEPLEGELVHQQRDREADATERRDDEDVAAGAGPPVARMPARVGRRAGHPR